MALEFKLPDLGEGLSEGEIVAWKVKEGDPIAADQPLVSILTDKAEVEIPSPKAGTVLKQLFQAGQKVQVGQVFVVIGEKGEAYGSGNGKATAVAHSGPVGSTSPKGGGETVAAGATAPAGAGASATPAVRKLAKDLGVNIDSLTGTGPGGRITVEDVKSAGGGADAPAGAKAAAAPMKSGGPEERVVFAGIRRRTAEKMVQSSNTIPHVTHIDQADVT